MKDDEGITPAGEVQLAMDAEEDAARISAQIAVAMAICIGDRTIYM